MKKVEKFLNKYFLHILVCLIIFTVIVARADYADPAQDEMSADFLLQVVQVAQQLGGAKWGASVTVGLLILISTIKTSMLRKYWDLIGSLKILVAPGLAVIAGIASLQLNPESKNMWPLLAAWAFAGSGSVLLHELLDAVKKLPFVGPKYDMMIDVVIGLLGGQKKDKQ